MLEKLKKALLFMTNTTRKKMVLCFMVIIVILISAYVYTYISGKELNVLFNNTLDKHLQLNDVYVNLAQTNNFLKKYLEDRTEGLYGEYTSSCAQVQASSVKLNNLVDDSAYNREIIDLIHMLESYIDAGNNSVDLSHEDKTTESNSAYDDSQKIYKQINNNFEHIYSIILQDSNNIKLKVIDNRNATYTFNAILIVIAAVVSLLFTQWFSISLTRPIKRLTNAAINVSRGDMSLVEIPVSSHDEISILTQAFNKMIQKIVSQIAEIKEKAELEKKLSDEEMENLKIKSLLKESELKALQSQINPHFLFNSLNMITQMSYIERAEVTSSLLESMSDLLRYNLDKFNKVVTLMEETGNLKDYIFIQEKRFGERIKFEISEDDGICKALIPCLVLQPLVENALIHGVGKYTENGLIRISILKSDNRIVIKIYDNGVGIERSKLSAVQGMLKGHNQNDDSSGIGVSNVFARLNLFYNNNVEADIKSKAGEYTELYINIPFMEEEK